MAKGCRSGLCGAWDCPTCFDQTDEDETDSLDKHLEHLGDQERESEAMARNELDGGTAK